jgi:hypothetical protein
VSQNTIKILEHIEEEILRAQLMLTENNYHHGTALNVITGRYITELKQYKQIVLADRINDKIESYDQNATQPFQGWR